jgi:hypothetical protein
MPSNSGRNFMNKLANKTVKPGVVLTVFLMVSNLLSAGQDPLHKPVLKDSFRKTVNENLQYLDSNLKLTASQKSRIRTILSDELAGLVEDQAECGLKLDRKSDKILADRQTKRWDKTADEISKVLTGVQGQDFQNLVDQIGNYLDRTYSLMVRLGLTYPQAEKAEEVFRTLPPPQPRDMNKDNESVGFDRQGAGRQNFSAQRAKFQKVEKDLLKILSNEQKTAYVKMQKLRMTQMQQRMKDRKNRGSNPGSTGNMPPPPPDR